MTFPDLDAEAPRRAPTVAARTLRDLLALVLVLIGGLGLMSVLFEAHPLAGAGFVFTVLLAAGLYLGYDRE